MAMIYVTDDAKKDLERLCDVENRSISKQVEFLVSQRIKEIDPSESQITQGEKNV